MEKQDTLRNLLIAGGVFLLVWFLGERFLTPPKPAGPVVGSPAERRVETAQEAGSGAAEVTKLPETPTAADSTAPVKTAGPSVTVPGEFRAVEADREETIAIGSAEGTAPVKGAPESPFRTRLVLSNLGAAVESATLTDHAQAIGDSRRYELLSTVGGGGAGAGAYRSLAIEKVNVDDADLTLYDKRWHVGTVTRDDSAGATASGEHRAEFWIDLAKAERPVLRLTRSFVLPAQSRDSGRRDLVSELRVENLSAEPHQVIVTFLGGIGVLPARPPQEDRIVDVGVRTADGRVLGRRGKTWPEELFRLSAAEPNVRLSWGATANTYFTCTVAPVSADSSESAEYVTAVSAVDLDGSETTLDDRSLRFVTRRHSLGPNLSVQYKADIYVGEKDGEAFRAVPAYRERNYYFQIAQGYSICTFSFLVELMIGLLNGIHKVLPNYGVAIIILVLIVRTLLHPITKKGQVNMVRMQKQMGELAPRMEEIKKKFANDKVRLQQETMKLYRECGVSPASQFLTCLPMLLQMPVWVALWLSLGVNVRMRHQPFMGWIQDLTAPDALYTFASPWVVPLFGWTIPDFNLLPILMAVAMYLQMKLQPKPKPNPNLTPQQREQQEMMQKMMPMMTVMMLLIFYKMPSGLTLYVTASSFFGTIEQWRIRAHIKAKEAAGTLHGRSPTAPRDGSRTRKIQVPAWLEWLQKKADETQRLQRSQKARPRR
jgi:YidC/Oxa1 family membrane protein insertase